MADADEVLVAVKVTGLADDADLAEITSKRAEIRDAVGGRLGPIELEERLVVIQFIPRSEVARLASSSRFTGRISIFEVPTGVQNMQNLNESLAQDEEIERQEREDRRTEERRWEEERERRRRWEEERRREDRHDERRRRERDERRRDEERHDRSPRDRFPEVRNRLPRYLQNCLQLRDEHEETAGQLGAYVGHSSQAYILKTQLARKGQLPPPERDPRRTYHRNRDREDRRQRNADRQQQQLHQQQPQPQHPATPQASASLPAIAFPGYAAPSIHTPAFQEMPEADGPIVQMPIPVLSTSTTSAAPLVASVSPPSLPLPLAIMPAPSATPSEGLPWFDPSAPMIPPISNPLNWRYNQLSFSCADPTGMYSPALDFMLRPPILWPTAPPIIDQVVAEGIANIELYEPVAVTAQPPPAEAENGEPLPPGLEV